MEKTTTGQDTVAAAFTAVAGIPPTRLFINADNDHYFRRGADQMTEAAMAAYIDEVAAGGKVTDFLMCAMGQRASYDSAVCEPIWFGEGAPGDDGWPRNARLCKERGLDIFAIWIRRCRERGITPWVSMRMNDIHGVTTENSYRVCKFWREHPEFRRCPDKNPYTGGSGWMPFALDYAHKEVRDYHFAIFRELVDRYDADGYELDWMRWPCVFRPGRENEDAHFLAAFMRDCRKYARAAEAKRGHPIKIGVRMPPKLVCAEAFGLRPVDWAAEGLVDLIVPTCFIQAYDFEMDLAGWKKAVAAANPATEVVPGGANMCSSSDYDGAIDLDLATWRGWCDRMFSQGAAGIYLFNADYLAPEVKGEIYRNGIDPVSAAKARRRLLASFDDCTSVEGTLGQRCPFPSREGREIWISSGSVAEVASVAVVCAASGKCEPPAVELNGIGPVSTPVRLTDMSPYCAKRAKDAWRWDFPREAYVKGVNRVSVKPNPCAAQGDEIVWCEISLNA